MVVFLSNVKVNFIKAFKKTFVMQQVQPYFGTSNWNSYLPKKSSNCRIYQRIVETKNLKVTGFCFSTQKYKTFYLLANLWFDLFFFFLSTRCGLWDFSSPTRDRTWALGSDSVVPPGLARCLFPAGMWQPREKSEVTVCSCVLRWDQLPGNLSSFGSATSSCSR